MTSHPVWHEDEGSWQAFRPFLFPPEKIDEARTEVDQLLTLLDSTPDIRILDSACGVGRHAIVPSKRRFTVTGVYATRPFLETAAQRAQEEGVEPAFVHGDMRRFKRAETFDVILNLYTSFGYFDAREEDETVACISSDSSKPEGGRC